MLTTQLSWGATECRDVNTKLSIIHSPGTFEAFATVYHQGVKYQVEGIYTITRDFMYKIHNYTLMDDKQNHIDLQISEQKTIGRGGCGRGGCNNLTSDIWANISINGSEGIIIPCQ